MAESKSALDFDGQLKAREAWIKQLEQEELLRKQKQDKMLSETVERHKREARAKMKPHFDFLRKFIMECVQDEDFEYLLVPIHQEIRKHIIEKIDETALNVPLSSWKKVGIEIAQHKPPPSA